MENAIAVANASQKELKIIAFDKAFNVAASQHNAKAMHNATEGSSEFVTFPGVKDIIADAKRIEKYFLS